MSSGLTFCNAANADIFFLLSQLILTSTGFGTKKLSRVSTIIGVRRVRECTTISASDLSMVVPGDFLTWGVALDFSQRQWHREPVGRYMVVKFLQLPSGMLVERLASTTSSVVGPKRLTYQTIALTLSLCGMCSNISLDQILYSSVATPFYEMMVLSSCVPQISLSSFSGRVS
jgi:hypothetical protein